MLCLNTYTGGAGHCGRIFRRRESDARAHRREQHPVKREPQLVGFPLFSRVFDSSYSGVDILLNPKQLMDVVYHYHVDLASRNSCLDSGHVKHLQASAKSSPLPASGVLR